ncbi:hypothetical protein ACKU07_00005 [Enterobacter hormaechei]
MQIGGYRNGGDFPLSKYPRDWTRAILRDRDPFLIQCAVREHYCDRSQAKNRVWGGHPAITPMIWSICE